MITHRGPPHRQPGEASHSAAEQTLLDWLTDSVKPYLEHALPIDSRPEQTGLVGYSLGDSPLYMKGIVVMLSDESALFPVLCGIPIGSHI